MVGDFEEEVLGDEGMRSWELITSSPNYYEKKESHADFPLFVLKTNRNCYCLKVTGTW